MALLQELDLGTPIRLGEPSVTLTIDGRKVSVPAGASVMAAAALIDNPIPKLCATDNLEPFGSCRLCLVEIDGRKGTPASCTTPAEEGMVVHTQTPRLEKLRRGVMELYLSDYPLEGLASGAVGDSELRTQAERLGVTETRYGRDGANHLDAPVDASNPYFVFDPTKCIVCSRCVRACDEVQGTFALTILGRGFEFESLPRRHRLPPLRMRLLRRLRSSLPDRVARGKVGHRNGNARAHGGDDLRLLRRWLRLQGGIEGRYGDPHGSLQGRQGQRGPFLRQGPVRLRLRHPPRPHPQTDGAPAHRRPLAGSLMARGDPVRRRRVQTHSGALRARLRRRDHLLALHQRGGVHHPEDGARGLRQQQRRHLCARLPFADRVRPQDNLRDVRRHPGFPVGRQVGRRRRHRRQSDRRPSGVRLAAQKAAARRRAPHRHRPAPHRSGEEPACRSRPSSGAEARNQRCGPERNGPCRGHRTPRRRGLRAPALRQGEFRVLGALRGRRAQFAGGDRRSHWR